LNGLFYLRKGVVYIPTMAREQSGIYCHVEPVFSVPVADEIGFRTIFQKLVAQGNPLIPNRPRNIRGESPILKLAGLKTFSAFARDTLVWGVEDLGGHYTILPYKDGKPRGWVPDRERKVEFAPGTAEDEVADRLVSMIQAADAVGR
jgi:hypothetical protein